MFSKIYFFNFDFFLEKNMSELAIQATAVDAVSCKVYCVRNNYYSDAALLRLFPATVDRKSPEIARGTWARVHATRNFVKDAVFYRVRTSKFDPLNDFCTAIFKKVKICEHSIFFNYCKKYVLFGFS